MSTPFRPVTLAGTTEARIVAARTSGALRPIVTEQTMVEEGGVRFCVRVVSSLARKIEDRDARQSSTANPFQPWDPDLFVADVSDTHVALLNKFPVLDRHLLIVTRRFMHQETLLDEDDFVAIGRCLDAIDGLVFYNGGEDAGASQPHKHLQLVPLPLAGEGPPVPMEPLLSAASLGAGGIGQLPGFGFPHGFCRLADSAPGTLLARYRHLLDEVGLGPPPLASGSRQTGPYNLLCTRSWMLLVPRGCECCRGVSVNALGYAGSLFVRNRAHLDAVRRVGPLTLLRQVSLPAP